MSRYLAFNKLIGDTSKILNRYLKIRVLTQVGKITVMNQLFD